MKTFKENWLDVSGEYISVSPDRDICELLIKFLSDNDIKSLVLADAQYPTDLLEKLKSGFEILADFRSENTSIDEAKALCNRADAGVSTADALISATGSVVIATNSPRDKMVSSLPEIHIVIATDTPVFKDQHDYLKTAPSDSAFCFITGPSRTADIEKTLILGAHGPKRVIVFGR
ncbi:lactate utilization protein [bacterium]|nr:lactate utilization protein [bacterium]